MAATLFFVVAAVGLKSPLIAVLAFVPMLLCSIGFSELNKADPDCGTTFILGTRAFGPAIGWAGGWATVAAERVYEQARVGFEQVLGPRHPDTLRSRAELPPNDPLITELREILADIGDE